MRISKRLKSLSQFINSLDKVIDIGCDHALLDIYLIQEKKFDKIIISDINQLALNQGIQNIKKYHLENHIEVRLGNGLEVINDKDDIDTIIMSGMGTNTILKILNKKNLKNINKLIIQSNNNYELLRKEIIKLGFYIDKEEAIEDNNKVYLNIIFKKGSKNITSLEQKYGLNSMINKQVYYKYIIEKDKKILLKVNNILLKKEIDYLNSIIKK